MKKFIMICIVAAFATSCKKDYSCVCTSVDVNNGKTETTIDTFKAKSKKKDAQAWCEGLQKTKVDFAGSTSSSGATCVLQ